jgi:hypothetical protein
MSSHLIVFAAVLGARIFSWNFPVGRFIQIVLTLNFSLHKICVNIIAYVSPVANHLILYSVYKTFCVHDYID